MYAIKTDNLTKYYGKTKGIENVNLTVEEGDFFGFIGPNGAGKSTTIRTLLGLLFPTSGKAEVLGLDSVTDKTKILEDVGYLSSEAMFYSGMRARDVIALSAKLRRRDCSKEASELCERFDLDTSKKIGQLSLGNRKKVGIVCALQHNPRLYVLDEPTSGLDPLMQQEFYNVLNERNRNGATIFLSSHILPEVSKNCRHAAVIRDGNILVSDSIEKFKHTGVKRVRLKGIEQLPATENVKDVKYEDGYLNFLYGGEAQELVSTLSKLSFSDVTITDPDLDEVFFHYYTKEGN